MYIPAHFDQTDSSQISALIEAFPLATLVVNDGDGLYANHIPMVLVKSDTGIPQKLMAHVPRSNPLAQHGRVARSCLAVFHGPQGYISPSNYATKAEHGRVVPTWNYAVVHIHGSLTLIDSSDWIRTQLELLVRQMEESMPSPWHVDDAPADFTDRLTEALVGLEITVEKTEAKWKLSQNQPAANKASLLAAFQPGSESDARTGRTASSVAIIGQRKQLPTLADLMTDVLGS
ncbi:MAG: FMN-binding negative transcriptional regulator [Pseudomonadales bacterium]|nr:FMN-binding negative transcriptional regulator [Pseudomonadales bacterium]